MLIAEFFFLFVILYIGSRFGGLGLGAISGLGLAIEVFVLRMPPSSPPVDVMLIIIAVVCCASILDASGGLKYLLQIAEKILRKNPKRITFLVPITTYLLSLILGTGHAVYSIMPIIGDIALKNNIRPERPMAAASVASQLALTSSPIAAVVACYLGKDVLQIPGLENLTLFDILMVNFPATFLGVIAMCIYSNYRGKELKDDAEFQTRLIDPEFKRQIETSTQTNLGEQLPLSSKISVAIFLLALLVIVTTAVFPQIRTIGNMQSPISMSVIIQIMMLAFGAIILFATKTDVKSIPQSVVFKSGMTACVAIFGIAWMADTFFKTAMPEFKAAITYIVEDYPWTFALATILVCMSVNSQAATAKIIIPIAVAIGLPGPILIGLMPATYFYFFFPVYPSDVATMNFDITGTTRIGKWYFNHSFMLPGIISMTTACCVGLTMAKLVL